MVHVVLIHYIIGMIYVYVMIVMNIENDAILKTPMYTIDYYCYQVIVNHYMHLFEAIHEII